MPASVFMAMNDDLQRIFAHDGNIIWFRPGGPVDGHTLTAWFDQQSVVAEAGSLDMVITLPKLTIFVADIHAIDPARRTWDRNELFRNDGLDRFEVDGVGYRVESCTADGFDKVAVELKAE